MGGADVLDAGDGGDVIVAISSNSDTVLGSAGDDIVAFSVRKGKVGGVVDGGPGRDGVELYAAGATGDHDGVGELDAAAGSATVRYPDKTVSVPLASFELFVLWEGSWTFTGTDGDDEVHVREGSLEAYGLGGDDLLLGDVEDDVLDGGAGTDAAWGGSGSNICVDTEEGDCDGWPYDGPTLGSPADRRLERNAPPMLTAPLARFSVAGHTPLR